MAGGGSAGAAGGVDPASAAAVAKDASAAAGAVAHSTALTETRDCARVPAAAAAWDKLKRFSAKFGGPRARKTLTAVARQGFVRRVRRRVRLPRSGVTASSPARSTVSPVQAGRRSVAARGCRETSRRRRTDGRDVTGARSTG